MITYTSQEIAQQLGAKLIGKGDLPLSGVDFIADAGPEDLTFIGDKRYLAQWADAVARVTLLSEGLELESGEGRALIRVSNADLAMAQVLELFAPPPPACEPGVHVAAVVDPSAELGEGCHIGPGCVVGPKVKIGPGCVLYAQVTVMEDSQIGPGCTFWPGVVIRERSQIGAACIFHPNVSIGADGFGYRPDPGGAGLVKIPHIGNVQIGNAVELGANTAVDRGKFGATIIGDGTKVDNLVQIAHNCKIGRCCVIAAHSAIAGSSTLGDGVMMGGCVGVKDHCTVGDGVKIGGGTMITKDRIEAGSTILGYPAMDARQCLRVWAAQQKMLKTPKKSSR